MRTLLFLVLAVVVLALVGWITFNVTSDKASVNVETEKIESDTEQIMEAGERMLEETGTAIDRATEEDDVDVEADGETIESEQIEVDAPVQSDATIDERPAASLPAE